MIWAALGLRAAGLALLGWCACAASAARERAETEALRGSGLGRDDREQARSHNTPADTTR
jgi:hypothetical protein